MSKAVINTHSGDDSDGKLWGIEKVNILFILAGLLLSVGLSLRRAAPDYARIENAAFDLPCGQSAPPNTAAGSMASACRYRVRCFTD
jgi:hypothetical protein